MKGEWYLPKGFRELASRFAARMPGDLPSIAAAQFALETGRGMDVTGRGGDLWRDYGNPWCVKAATDRRYQAGATDDGYAIYHSLEQAFADRLRILAMYRKWAISRGIWHGDVMGLVDRWWAPDQRYRIQLESIVARDELWKMDRAPSL